MNKTENIDCQSLVPISNWPSGEGQSGLPEDVNKTIIEGIIWEDYPVVNDPNSGKKLPNEGHADDSDWEDFEVVNDPNSGKTLPNEGHAEDADWEDFEVVNDPNSGKKLPNEGHADDSDWEDFEVVNDPNSGKKLPNEGHADDSDWEDFEVVNDPNSGKTLPNEGHAEPIGGPGVETAWPPDVPKKILITRTFQKNIHDIYGDFTKDDDEYPAMGITIQGAPVFVECLRFPEEAVIRRKTSDEVRRDHPSVGALWEEQLRRYRGRCRTSTVHIHPMDLPCLSGRDVHNFDSLRLDPDDPSTFPSDHPYPVILVNLIAGKEIEILGFWVFGRSYRPAAVRVVPDSSPEVRQAWELAQPEPYFSREAELARKIDRKVSKDWRVELGVNRKSGRKALKASRKDGSRVLFRFDPDCPFGLREGKEESEIPLEDYLDWNRLLEDCAEGRLNPQDPTDLSALPDPVEKSASPSPVPSYKMKVEACTGINRLEGFKAQ